MRSLLKVPCTAVVDGIAVKYDTPSKLFILKVNRMICFVSAPDFPSHATCPALNWCVSHLASYKNYITICSRSLGLWTSVAPHPHPAWTRTLTRTGCYQLCCRIGPESKHLRKFGVTLNLNLTPIHTSPINLIINVFGSWKCHAYKDTRTHKQPNLLSGVKLCPSLESISCGVPYF